MGVAVTAVVVAVAADVAADTVVVTAAAAVVVVAVAAVTRTCDFLVAGPGRPGLAFFTKLLPSPRPTG